jgi:Ca2+-binding EF-hand superfamily protein
MKERMKRAGVTIPGPGGKSGAAHTPMRDSTNVQSVEVVMGPTSRGSASREHVVHPPTPTPLANDPNLLKIAKDLKAKLGKAEEQVRQLKDQNDNLTATLSQRMAQPMAPGAHTSADTEGQLRETSWRLQQLQTQYDFLVAKTSAQSEAYKKSEDQIDESSQKVRDLRRTLEELRHEKEISDAKALRCAELEDHMTELKSEKRGLEDKIARLCETPFISDAFGQQESRMRLEEAAREREEYKAKVVHLQEAVRTHFSALNSLKNQAAEMREEKEAAERAAEDMKMKYQELEAGTSLLQDKLRLYSGDDGVDIESLERALTLVKRRGEALEKLPFLEDPDGEGMLTVPALKKKMESVQILNMKLSEEVERLENMLKLQSGINKDLHKELETMVHKGDKDKRELLQRAEDFEQISLKRLEKIHNLEAQLRQFVYGVSKGGKKGSGSPGGAVISAEPADNASTLASEEHGLLNELLDEKDGDISPDDNLLEIWVRGATFKEGLIGPGASTFAVIDFFDYESQTTTLVGGQKPSWDFAATYKMVVDDFLLRYLATDVVTIELNMAAQGDFTLLARCSIPLSGLLRSKPVIKIPASPMISVNTGEIIAHVNIEARLAIPVSELYRLFLERHPSEKRQIEDISTRRVLEAAGDVEHAKQVTSAALAGTMEDEARLYNELEIAILNANDLPKAGDDTAPSAYVHFQLLFFPERFTNPIPNTSDPAFNERFPFPIITNDKHLRLLQRSKLQLMVVDMKGEESDDKSDGLIGEVNIPLKELAEGLGISDGYHIRNADGKKVGEIHLAIRWKNKFRKQRELGPKALSGVEVESLIAAFSAGEEKQGTVDYKAFCRFANPPTEVLACMEKLRVFCAKITDREGRPSREILRVLFDLQGDGLGDIEEEHFVECLLKTQIDAFPADFSQLFRFVDLDEDKAITLDQILAVLNLDDIAGVNITLQDKLRERSKDLVSRNLSLLSLFREADQQWGEEGIVTRSDFKRVLTKMGFQLVDEPSFVGDSSVHLDAASEYAAYHRARKGGGVGAMRSDYDDDDPLNESDDMLLPAEGEEGKSFASRNKSRIESLQKQREMFEARRAEMQVAGNDSGSKAVGHRGALQAVGSDSGSAARHAEMAASSAGGGMRRQESESEMKAEATAVGVNLLDEPQAGSANVVVQEVIADPYTADHHASVSASKGDIKNYDEGHVDKLVTKVQSRYRGYSVRKESPPKGAAPGSALVLGHAAMAPSQLIASKSSLLSAEQTIRESLAEMEGVKPLPNLLETFSKVDSGSTGFVNRAQFAFVIQQHRALKLQGLELRACMDHFDASSDGTKIDYTSFVRFVKYRAPVTLPAIEKLQSMAFLASSVLHMRKYDTSGTGFIKRSDMLHVLGELGYDHVPQGLMQSTLQLFETKEEGKVNYANFIEYAREGTASAILDSLSNDFHMLVAGESNVQPEERDLRDVFKRICTNNEGKFGVQELAMFLNKAGIRAPSDTVLKLFVSMDSSGDGVRLSDLVSWARSYPASLNAAASLYSHTTMAEIQRKAHTFMLSVAATPGFSLEELLNSYYLYDWRRPTLDYVDRDIFMNATYRVGFPFTTQELKQLANEFKRGDNVQYKRFLSWTTPASQTDIASNSKTSAPSGPKADSQTKSVSAIVVFLEDKAKAHIDLLSVFSRYDAAQVGRITADEFCAGLSDLGISTVTRREALEVADRLRSSAADFVLYRRLVSELLKRMDEDVGADKIDPVDVVRAAMKRVHVEPKRLRHILEYYDRSRPPSGNIREEDLAVAFEEANMRLHGREIDAIVDRYSTSLRGYVKYTALMSDLEKRLGERLSSTKYRSLPEDLPKKLRDFLERLIIRGVDFRGEFDKFDDDHSGSVPQAMFREVLQDRLDAKLSARELEALESRYRSGSNPRCIDFTKFIHDMHPRHFGQDVAENGPPQGSPTWEIIETLRLKIRRRYDIMTPGELKRPFRHFARKKGADSVALEDFAIGVRDLGYRIAGDQEREIFDAINLSGGQSFKYTDFVVFIKDPLHADVIWKIRRLINRQNIGENELVGALTDLDSNSSGLLSLKQLARAFRSCDLSLSESDIMRLTYRFDKEESQRCDINKFMRFLRGKSTDADPESPKQKKVMMMSEKESFLQLRDAVTEKLESGHSSREVYAHFDSEMNRGTIDTTSMQVGARELGLTFSQFDCKSILRRMTTVMGGPIRGRRAFYEALGVDYEALEVAPIVRSKGAKGRYYDDSEEDEDDTAARRRRRRRAGDNAAAAAAEATFDSIREKLKEGAIDRGKDARGNAEGVAKDFIRTMYRYAKENPSYVSQEELVKVFAYLEADVSHKMLTRVFDALDPQLTSFVKSTLLVESVFPDLPSSVLIDLHEAMMGESHGAEGGSRKSSSRSIADDEEVRKAAKRHVARAFKNHSDVWSDVLADLRRQLRRDRHAIDDLKSLFKRTDADRLGTLTNKEFINCLTQNGVHIMSEADKREVAVSISDDDARHVDYIAFIDALKEEFEGDKDRQDRDRRRDDDDDQRGPRSRRSSESKM